MFVKNKNEVRFCSVYIPKNVTIMVTTNATSKDEWLDPILATAQMRNKYAVDEKSIAAFKRKTTFYYIDWCLSKDQYIKTRFMKTNVMEEDATPYPKFMKAENDAWFADPVNQQALEAAREEIKKAAKTEADRKQAEREKYRRGKKRSAAQPKAAPGRRRSAPAAQPPRAHAAHPPRARRSAPAGANVFHRFGDFVGNLFGTFHIND